MSYGQSSTQQSLASSIASLFHNDPSSYVDATATGSTVSFTGKGAEGGTNWPIALTSTYDTVHFTQPSFPAQNGTLSGGTSSQTPLYSFTIPTSGGFAPDGNILQANDTVNGNWIYTYDTFNRLATGVAANIGAQRRAAVRLRRNTSLTMQAGSRLSWAEAATSCIRTCLLLEDFSPPIQDYRRNSTFLDWLGRRRLQFNAQGQMTETCSNLLVGDGQSCAGTNDATEHHFTGKEWDSETGLNYFGARYYGSNLGRFTSPDYQDSEEAPDAIPYGSVSNPQSFNLYSYAQNNPLRYWDADGHSVEICSKLNGTQHCSGAIDNDSYNNAANGDNGSLNVPSLQDLKNNGSGNITDANGNVVGTASYTPDNPGIEGPANLAAARQLASAGATISDPRTIIGFYGASALAGGALYLDGAFAGELSVLGDITIEPSAGQVAQAQRVLAKDGPKQSRGLSEVWRNSSPNTTRRFPVPRVVRVRWRTRPQTSDD